MTEFCRLCLGKRLVKQEIFGVKGVSHIINACLPIKVSETDNLPKKVCKTCVQKLTEIYEFCQAAVGVQKLLTSGSLNLSYNGIILKESHNVKEEPFDVPEVQSGVIIFGESPSNANKFLVSKCTQTDFDLANFKDGLKNSLNSDLHHQSTENVSDVKIKLETSENRINSTDDFDHYYSSEDDLALTNVLGKVKEEYNSRLSKVDKVVSKRNAKKVPIKINCPIPKATLSKKKKGNVSNRTNKVKNVSIKILSGPPEGASTKKDIKERTGSKNRKNINSWKKSKAVDETEEDSGDKYFYPEGTAEELKKWQCLTCFVFVKSRKDLFEHYREHATNPLKFLPKNAPNEHEISTHPESVDLALDSTDVLDAAEFKKKESAQLGLDYAVVNNSEFSDSTAYQCLKCFKMFLNRKAVVRHHVSHDEARPYPCNMCGRTYKKVYEIVLHGRVHNGFKTLSCKYPACDYKTVYRGAFRNHMKRHDGDGTFKYTCETCQKGFDVLTWYNEHKNVHLGIKPFKCDICDKSYVHSRYLTSHRKYVHPETDEKSGKQLFHRCSICPRHFTQWRRLRAHIKKDHSEEGGTATVLCDICGKGLSTKEHLKFHRRTHTGEKPFVCGTCGKGFVKKCNLKLHERTHSGEKPYVCSHCSKAFSQRSTLVIHERYHSGVRPYVCNICNKGFVAKGLLSMHQKTCL